MVKFYDTNSKVTEGQIENLETKLNFKFPREYKEHLLQFNGGRCEPNTFSFEENGKRTESVIHYFSTIKEGSPYDIFSDFEIFKGKYKRMPSSIFPIACDPGGNQICLDIIGGKVYFWDHEREVDYTFYNDNVRTNLYFIADNLSEFFAELKI